MAKYCDSAQLERNWFSWLLASSVPQLDDFRRFGLLWTKVVEKAKDREGNIITKNGKTFPDACGPRRLHCLALGIPVFFESYDGQPAKRGILPNQSEITLTKIRKELTLCSTSKIHNLKNLFVIRDEVIPMLLENEYIQEQPEELTWELMLCDINNICHGVASRFNPATEEELHDLANEAITQVIKKLKSRKLVYIPGFAPVFNLLTTTIFRCMYSICNRKKQQRLGLHKLVGDAKAGVLPNNIRSFRVVSGNSSKLGIKPI
jgi:uncharacterized protein YbaR (Trm112 family)